MIGEIYLVVLFAVGMISYCHFKEELCKDDDEIEDLDLPIYK
jgi:hypothetical protein